MGNKYNWKEVPLDEEDGYNWKEVPLDEHDGMTSRKPEKETYLEGPEVEPMGLSRHPKGYGFSGEWNEHEFAPVEALGAFTDTVSRIPENLAAKVVMAAQGQSGASVADRGVADKFVNWVEDRNRKLSERYEGSGDLIPGVISNRDVADLGPNLAFSGTSMAGTVGGGLAGGLLGPPGAIAGGVAGGGATAYRMDSYQAMNDWLKKVNQESIDKGLGPISKEEEEKFKDEMSGLATKHGLWEAGPEGLGNVLELALLTAKNIPGVRWLPKGTLGKAAKGMIRLGGTLLTEEATETATQMGQHNVEVEAGTSDEPKREWTSGDDILKSAKEVLPQVLMLSGVMTAGGAAYRKAKGATDEVNLLNKGMATREDKQREKFTNDLLAGMESGEMTPERMQDMRDSMPEGQLADVLDGFLNQPEAPPGPYAGEELVPFTGTPTGEPITLTDPEIIPPRETPPLELPPGQGFELVGDQPRGFDVVPSTTIRLPHDYKWEEVPIEPAALPEKTDVALEGETVVPPEAAGAIEPEILPVTPAQEEVAETTPQAETVAEAKGVKEPWAMDEIEYAAYDKEKHPLFAKGLRSDRRKQEIRQALSEGKVVPEVVLKDYPDLKTVPTDRRQKQFKDLSAEERRIEEDRRRDLVNRKMVSEMTPEEKDLMILTSHVTGLPNQRAYDEAVKKADKKTRTGFYDLDVFKDINDKYGHPSGDDVLRAVANAMRTAGGEIYHLSGDEYAIRAESDEFLDNAAKVMYDYLQANPVEVGRPGEPKTKVSVEFSYGKGKDLPSADAALEVQKDERKRLGYRHDRKKDTPETIPERKPEGDKAVREREGDRDAVGKRPATRPEILKKEKLPDDRRVEKPREEPAVEKIVQPPASEKVEKKAVEKEPEAPPPTTKPDIEITGKKEKDVKVDIPKKEADALTPKEQKKYLIDEIDAVIETAKEGEVLKGEKITLREPEEQLSAKRETNREVYQENVEKYGTVKIHVPGDGDFTVLNNKTALAAFKKKAGKMPLSALAPKKTGTSLKPTGKRITGEGIEYYNEYKPRKQRLIESKEHPGGNIWQEPYYSDRGYIIKLDKKPKFRYKIAEEAPALKTYIEEHATEEGYSKAEIKGETYTGVAGGSKIIADVVTSDGNHIPIQAKYADHILTEYPKARVSAKDHESVVLFKQGGEIVGIVMPIKGGDTDLAYGHDKLYGKKEEQYSTKTVENIASAATKTPEVKKWFRNSKVVDKKGSPQVVYSGHGNIAMWGDKYIPSKATAGAFYSTENPDISSGYAMGKLGDKSYSEYGNQYRLKNRKTGKYNKKLWQYEFTNKQLEKIEELKKRADDADYDEGYEIGDMDSWVEDNKRHDAVARKMSYQGTRSLQNIWQFYEYMGYTIAYDKGESTLPITERQQQNRFEDLMDILGIGWNSSEWAQPGVMPLILRIENPIDTSKDFPQDLLDALDEKSKYEKNRSMDYINFTRWTKDYPLKEWVKDIKREIETGEEQFWPTHVPKKALPIIKSFGYDGIKDTGGKGGGQKHNVWMAFDANQIKSVFNLKPTEDPRIMYSTKTTFKDSDISLKDLQELFKHQKVNRLPDDTVSVKTALGKGFVIEFVETIAPDKAAFKVAYGRVKGSGELIAGKYKDDKITISKIGDIWTVAHEGHGHWAEEMGFINKNDQKALKYEIRHRAKTGKWETLNQDDIGGKEDRAEFIAQELKKRTESRSTVQRVIQKIQDLIDAFVNLYKRTARGVVKDISSGKIYEKEGTPEIKQKALREGMFATKDAAANRGKTKLKVIKSSVPKESVLSVAIKNKAPYGIRYDEIQGSGEAYLDKFGNVILDGVKYTVGEKAYLHNGKFYKTPPKELLKQVRSIIDGATGYTGGLKKTMWEIRWKEPKEKTVKKGDKHLSLFGNEEIATEDFLARNDKRYENIDAYHQRYIHDVESLVSSPNADKLMDALYKEELDKKRTFHIGGYLHLAKDGQQLSKVQKAAIQYYLSNGGQAGLNTVTALDSPTITKGAAIAFPEFIDEMVKPTKKKIKEIDKKPEQYSVKQKDDDYVKGFLKKYEVDTHQKPSAAPAVRDTADKTGTFQETLEPVTEEDYISNRKTDKSIKLKAATNIKRVASEVAEIVDKYLGSISTRLGQASPKLKAKLRKLDFDINIKAMDSIKAVEPLLKKAKKMTREDFADWDYARKNSDIKKIDELINKYGMQKEYIAYRKVLDGLREEGIDVGLEIGEIEDYAPRILKDSKGFLAAIGKAEEWPVYSRRLQEKAQELGLTVAEMDSDMKAGMISNMILGGWAGLGGIPSTKQRKLQKIPAYLNKYYMDSDAALMQHVHSIRKNIEARKFFGKIPEKVKEMRTRMYRAQTKIRELNEKLKDKLPENELAKIKKQRNEQIGLEKQYAAYIQKYALQRDYTENIGAYIIELIEKKEITPRHERVVNDMLKARFHEVGTHGVVQAYKNMSYIDTMGSPISALTQIGDLAWAAYEGGLIRALKHASKAAVGKSRITRQDVGVERIAQEFADSGMLGNAVTKVFKMVGLEKIDAIGKESLLNTALDKYQKQAMSDPAKLKNQIEPIFEGETDSVIDDLANDEISENVKLLVYSRLLDFQPVGLSEMPQGYLAAGNWRLFYMLKTFTIKVFDVFRNEAYYKIKKGSASEKIKGLKNLARLSFFFVLANAGADELKDWVLGRKTDFSDRMVDNALRLFGISKFVTWKARTEGVGSALSRQILPPFKFVDSLGKDIITAGDEKGLEVVGSIPVVGKLAYWHVGRGVSKRGDLWDRRWRKRKSKLNEVKNKLEKSKDKRAFRHEHRNELLELRQINSLQGRLNGYRKRINRLKSKEETVDRKKAIQRLESKRTGLIKDFLGEKTKRQGHLNDFTKEYVSIRKAGKSLKELRKDVIEYNRKQEAAGGRKIPWSSIVKKGNRIRKRNDN